MMFSRRLTLETPTELFPNAEVLAFATVENRIVLSHNRRDFLRLHNQRTHPHAGMVLCTFDADFVGLAGRIHAAVAGLPVQGDQVIRIYRPA